MDQAVVNMVKGQFGAALDMLENAIDLCPEDLWAAKTQSPFHEFWYMAYHTLFWTELQLHGSVAGFQPVEPFGLEELDPAGAFPDRTYGKAELKSYLAHCRSRMKESFAQPAAWQDKPLFETRWGGLTYLELLLYCMRHIQHHAAQLNLILRQQLDRAPGWVGRTL